MISCFYFFCLFIFLFSPGYPAPSPSHPAQAGRVSVSESYHGGYNDHGQHDHLAAGQHDHLYGNNQGYAGNYDNYAAHQYYDPNLTANSVFEHEVGGEPIRGQYPGHVMDQSEGGEGMGTPLPGTLGLGRGHGAAPRAVFDEDQEGEPAPAPSQQAMFARPKSSLGADQHPGLFLCFCLQQLNTPALFSFSNFLSISFPSVGVSYY